MNREPGYYWIWDETNARWQAAEWSGRVFWLPGDEYGMSLEELVASGLGPIGPKIEPPPLPAVFDREASRFALLLYPF